jgi:hypothetical protein
VTTLSGTVTVSSPPATVAAVVLDWNQDVRWRTGVVGFDTDPHGPAVAGQQLRERLRAMGREVVTPTTVTAAVPGRSAAYVGGSGALAVAGRRDVTPTADGGSRVHVELTLALHGVLAPLTPLVGRVYRRRFLAELRDLGRLLEREPH